MHEATLRHLVTACLLIVVGMARAALHQVR